MNNNLTPEEREAMQKAVFDSIIKSNLYPVRAELLWIASRDYHTRTGADRLADVVNFAERIKREVGLSTPDPWRTILIERIDGEIQDFIAKYPQNGGNDE